MPTYDFYCKNCKKSFTRQMPVADHDKMKNQQQCPFCKGKEVKQQISMFEAKTSKKS